MHPSFIRSLHSNSLSIIQHVILSCQANLRPDPRPARTRPARPTRDPRDPTRDPRDHVYAVAFPGFFLLLHFCSSHHLTLRVGDRIRVVSWVGSAMLYGFHERTPDKKRMVPQEVR